MYSVVFVSAKRSVRQKAIRHRAFSLNSRDHAFAILGLKAFTDPEISKSFHKLQEVTQGREQNVDSKNQNQNLTVNVQEGIQRIAEAEYAVKIDQKTINKVTRLVIGGVPSHTGSNASAGTSGGKQEQPVMLTLPEYRKRVLELGERLDPRVWNIGLSFLCTGTRLSLLAFQRAYIHDLIYMITCKTSLKQQVPA